MLPANPSAVHIFMIIARSNEYVDIGKLASIRWTAAAGSYLAAQAHCDFRRRSICSEIQVRDRPSAMQTIAV